MPEHAHIYIYIYTLYAAVTMAMSHAGSADSWKERTIDTADQEIGIHFCCTYMYIYVP